MDPTYEYLWAAGYDLPPEPQPAPQPTGKLAFAIDTDRPPRRGKKAAKAKRARAK